MKFNFGIGKLHKRGNSSIEASKKHTLSGVLLVEMAGIEPASERIEHRTSTSVVVCLVSPVGLQVTKDSTS